MPRPVLRAPRSGRELLTVVGLVAVLVVAALGLALHGQRGDTQVDLLLGTPVIELFAGHRSLVVALAELGGPETIAPLGLLLALVLAVRRRWADAAAAVLAPAVAGTVQLVLKPLVDRPLGGQPAWPSGHASGTWALATVAVVLLLCDGRASSRRRRWLAGGVVVLAVVNAVGLVGAQYHFVTDVIGGAAVGIAAGCLVVTALAGRRRGAER